MRTVKMKPPRCSRSALLDSVQPRRSRSGFSGPRVRGQEHQGSPALALSLSPGSLLPTPRCRAASVDHGDLCQPDPVSPGRLPSNKQDQGARGSAGADWASRASLPATGPRSEGCVHS